MLRKSKYTYLRLFLYFGSASISHESFEDMFYCYFYNAQSHYIKLAIRKWLTNWIRKYKHCIWNTLSGHTDWPIDRLSLWIIDENTIIYHQNMSSVYRLLADDNLYVYKRRLLIFLLFELCLKFNEYFGSG